MLHRFYRGVERVAGTRGSALARTAILILLAAMVGLGAHLAAELVARPDSIRRNVLNGFSQRLVGDESIVVELTTARQTHFSECIAFSILTNPRVEGALSRVMKMEASLWTPPPSMCSIYLAGVNDPSRVQWFSYARYWHGYLVAHKLVLSHFDYRTFLKIVNAVLVLALVVFSFTLAARVGLFPTLVLLAIFLLLSPTLWSWLNPTVALSFSSLLLAGAYFSRFGVDRPPRGSMSAAVLAGAFFNFFDFLYFPGLLAAMICWLAAVHQIGSRITTNPWTPAFLGISSLAGYLAMWSARWWIALLWKLVEHVELPNAGDFSRWLVGGDTYVSAVAAILERLFREPLNQGIAIVVTAVLLLFAIRFRMPFLRYFMHTSVVPAVLGLVVIEGMSPHSVAHPVSNWVIAWLVAMIAFNCAYYPVVAPHERLRRQDRGVLASNARSARGSD
jgi:hypothetical protein